MNRVTSKHFGLSNQGTWHIVNPWRGLSTDSDGVGVKQALCGAYIYSLEGGKIPTPVKQKLIKGAPTCNRCDEAARRHGKKSFSDFA